MVHIISLVYDITFNDSDDGDCYAGEGSRIVKVLQDNKEADEFIKLWNPIFIAAESEHIVYPVQAYNKKIRKEFGFVLDDIDQNAEKFRLVKESWEIN